MADHFAAAVDPALGALKVTLVTDDTDAPPQSGSTLSRILGSDGRVRVTAEPDPIGGGTPLTWAALTLLNSWVNFNAATHASAQYAKDSNDVVYLRGMIKNGTATAGTVLATLPVGFRPPKTVTFAIVADAAVEVLEVLTNGDIVLQTNSSSVYLSMSGVVFSITA